jgi:hypothetical protein
MMAYSTISNSVSIAHAIGLYEQMKRRQQGHPVSSSDPHVLLNRAVEKQEGYPGAR